MAFSGDQQTDVALMIQELVNSSFQGPTFPGKAYAVAFNANGTLYIGGTNGQVTTISMTTGISGNFVKLSFAPSSIAVDNVRGRVYFSDTDDSLIQVYSTQGVLLTTIK